MHVAQLASDAVEQPQSPISIAPHNSAPEGQSAGVTDVGDGLRDDDADRERRVQHHRDEMEAAMRDYEASSCFSDRGRADYHRIQFEREIAGRSAAQVARMAREQARRIAIEPGASAQ